MELDQPVSTQVKASRWFLLPEPRNTLKHPLGPRSHGSATLQVGMGTLGPTQLSAGTCKASGEGGGEEGLLLLLVEAPDPHGGGGQRRPADQAELHRGQS